MRRRPLALVLTAALIGAVFTALPARAATEVPASPNIVDPGGDANSHSSITGVGGGLNLNGADILAVWLTEDADNVYTHIQTTNGSRPESMIFAIYSDPSKGAECMQLRTTTGGNFNEPFASVNLTADCGTAGTTLVGDVTEEEGPDGTSILTSRYPKADVPLLANGTTIKAPNALVGWNTQQGRAGIIDDTVVGTDFTITGGGDEPPVVEEPEAPKPPKDPCKKLKGKKKKKCIKKHAVKACTAFQPGELGTDAETFVVTSAATEEAPMEAEVAIGPGAGGFGSVEGNENPAASKAYYNIQVDPEAAEAGLYVRLEFFEFEDYDMILYNPDGTEAANVGGGNVAPVGPLDGTGTGGHSEQGAEQFDGVKSADCQGYTLQITNPQGLGDIPGPLPLKLWLGEVQYDPAAPPAKAFVF